MANDLTTTSTPSRPVSLYSASSDYNREVVYGRCDQARLVDNLRDLLSLYYQPSETTEMRARQIALFVKDLADMSEDATGWAIDEWRRTQDRRPSPASLRQLCMVRRNAAAKALGLDKPSNPPGHSSDWKPATPEEKARIEDLTGRAFPELRRFPNGKRPPIEEPAERIPHWSETAAPDDPRFAELRRARSARA